MHVQKLLLQLSGLKFEKNRLPVTKGCKTNRLKFGFQVPALPVNELTLSAYNSLIGYKLSDIDVSRPILRLVATVRQRNV